MSDADNLPEPSDAVARQFRDLRGKLFAWLRWRVPNPVDAEDLLQDCFVRISQRDAAGSIENFEGYLFRTAASVLADRRRRRFVRRADVQVSLEADQLSGEEPDPLRALIAKDRLQRVAAALAGLPERTRAIFVLRRLEGLRYSEIAVRLKVSLSTVEKDMARAIEHLVSTVEDEA